MDIRAASTDYFRAMEIPLVKGRFFSEHDTSDSQQVVIIDEKFAQRFWPHDNPIGKHLWFDDPKKPLTISGRGREWSNSTVSIPTARSRSIFADQQEDRTAMCTWWRAPLPIRRRLRARLFARFTRWIRSAVIYDIRTMQGRLHDSLARQRFSTLMLGAFAGFALLLAAVGVYGVMS